MHTNKLIIIVSIIQIVIAITVSQVQSRKIKRNAKETKYVQLGFAFFVFITGLVQTRFLTKKIKSTNMGSTTF
ncbi:hypothetical protein J2S17_000763 [Cytobacillus purgationiresistens]|uniref:Uncharacterized protein n=2 Tax=Cytobacillus purgationiresistens TaxID=863449 RepID=A0ABU0ADD6_9BACI|nr:hypothetical protein [Cytobacillus purgationiresistens]